MEVLHMWIFMNGKRFWDGNTWVNEYPDATRYDVTNGNQLMATAKKIEATAIVKDYGLNTEKRIHVPWTAVKLNPVSELKEEAKEFVAYLTNRLIPDLKESGSECTAEDFEKAVRIINLLMQNG